MTLKYGRFTRLPREMVTKARRHEATKKIAGLPPQVRVAIPAEPLRRLDACFLRVFVPSCLHVFVIVTVDTRTSALPPVRKASSFALHQERGATGWHFHQPAGAGAARPF